MAVAGKIRPGPDMPDRLLGAGGPLELAAVHAEALGASWSERLDRDARSALIRGFFLAETLAGYAIGQAILQLPPEYRAELEAQADDEARHIALFAGWLDQVPVVPPPLLRQRQVPQWLVQLLVNELTGYCQFRLLASLVETNAQRVEVHQVARDEEVHIRRLLVWLEPFWGARSGQPLGGFIRRFRVDLPGRMCQFFPRAEQLVLRQALQEVVDTVLSCLPTQENAPEGWRGDPRQK